MRKLALALALVPLLLPVAAAAASLTVSWQANTEPDLAGYRIYYGTASGQYGPPVRVSAATTTYQLTGLAPSTRYFVALTAFNTAGFESGFSAEASATTLNDVAPGPPKGVALTPVQGPLAAPAP